MNHHRAIPAIDTLVKQSQFHGELPHQLLVGEARLLCTQLRQQSDDIPPMAEIVTRLDTRIMAVLQGTQQAVINATGVLLQTNLGRAPLSMAAQAAMLLHAGASSIEYDLVQGRRGERNQHLTPLLTRLTGAEAGLIVNNNAAALMLILAAHAVGKEVIVSRGQAVEIGGGFRIPDVLRQSGATLVEVGTTNRTYVADYAEAISERTAMILCVHTSNFRVRGFVHEPQLSELADLAHTRGIWLVDDVGSGTLLDVAGYGLTPEPRVPDRIAAGADIVCFSGDKLLGGPQAGLIVGRTAAIHPLARHPLMRALRVDKTIMAGVHATLASYVKGTAHHDIPIWQMIDASVATIQARAEHLRNRLGAGWQVRECRSAIGGGALPEDTLASYAVVRHGLDCATWARRLRLQRPAVVTRIADDALWCDMRSVLPEHDDALYTALAQLTAH